MEEEEEQVDRDSSRQVQLEYKLDVRMLQSSQLMDQVDVIKLSEALAVPTGIP